MNRSQFKNQYRYYRKTARAAEQDTAREWAETFNPLPRDNGSDILAARAAGFNFARVDNRHGQYGWESMGFHL